MNDLVMEQTEVNLGKAWAALRDDRVIGYLSMRVPKDVDFEEYRAKANECLSLLGTVKSRELVERGKKLFFVQRLNHANRSKNPRQPKEFEIFCRRS